VKGGGRGERERRGMAAQSVIVFGSRKGTANTGWRRGMQPPFDIRQGEGNANRKTSKRGNLIKSPDDNRILPHLQEWGGEEAKATKR